MFDCDGIWPSPWFARVLATGCSRHCRTGRSDAAMPTGGPRRVRRGVDVCLPQLWTLELEPFYRIEMRSNFQDQCVEAEINADCGRCRAWIRRCDLSPGARESVRMRNRCEDEHRT